MSPWALGVSAAAWVATVLSLVRWWRVAQREHYLPGRVSRFAFRWWLESRWMNRAAFVLAVAGLLAMVGVLASGSPAETAHPVSLVWSLLALPLVGAVALAPVGLGLRATSAKLVATRRLMSIGAATVLLIAGLEAGMTWGLAVGLSRSLASSRAGDVGPMSGVAYGLVMSAALGALAAPLVVDLALWLLAPLEGRVQSRYVRAAERRLQEVGPRVVAITGSFGKTTTKGYIAHLASGSFQVVASPASFNNQMGLARTVNEHLGDGTEVLLAEMGTYGPGEIARMCAWMRPHIAVMTAIGPVHLERFGTEERVLQAKSEIAEEAGIVVCNVDDQRLDALASELSKAGKTVWRCGTHGEELDVAVLPRVAGRVDVRIMRPHRVDRSDMEVPASIQPSGLACALAAALALGAEPEHVLGRIAGVPVASHRLEIGESASGVAVLDDTYNANPSGALAALRLLAGLPVSGRRVVVTPGMVELGKRQFAENAALARAAVEVATDLVVVGWTNRRALLGGAKRAGGTLAPAKSIHEPEEQPEMGCRVMVVPRRSEAVAWVRSNLSAGDAVLYENDLPDHFP